MVGSLDETKALAEKLADAEFRLALMVEYQRLQDVYKGRFFCSSVPLSQTGTIETTVEELSLPLRGVPH